VFFSLFTVFAARSDERSAFRDIFSNPWLWAAVGLALLLQVMLVYVLVLQRAFGTVRLSVLDWAFCALVGSSVLFLTEGIKLLARGDIVSCPPTWPDHGAPLGIGQGGPGTSRR
jgi:Ca2+-transporting ATPase